MIFVRCAKHDCGRVGGDGSVVVVVVVVVL